MNDETRLQVKKSLQTFQENLWKSTDEQWPQVVYHYTDVTGFRGIIESGVLWASDVLYATDPSEGRYSTQVVRDLISNRPDWACAKSLQLILCDPADPNRLFGLGRRWDHYIVSFCATIDSHSQWKNYGRNCTGVAIGIEPKDWRVTDRTTFFQLCYDRSVQQSKLTEVCGYAGALYRQLGFEPSDYNDFWSTAATEIMLRTLLRFKHPKYREEQEWRMLRATGENHAPKTRPSPKGNIPYVEVVLDPLALPCVVLGSATSDPDSRSVAEVLAKAGLGHVPVKRSSITCDAERRRTE